MATRYSEQQEVTHAGSAVEKAAAVVVAIAAVFSVVVESKSFALSAGLVIVALLVAVSTFRKPAMDAVRNRKARARRDKAAQAQWDELEQLIRRFGKFINPGEPKLRDILSNFLQGNDQLTQLCPPDFLRDLFSFFLARTERRPPKNGVDFCETVREFYGFVACFNRYYVFEPFRRMQNNIWPQQAPQEGKALGDFHSPGPWLQSLPPQRRTDAERQMEAFRERWVSYLDDLQPFLERLKDSLCGENLLTIFERPQKL